MHFPRVPASAVTSHRFPVPFNFIITTAVAYVPKMEHHWRSGLQGKRTPPFPMTNTALKGLVSAKVAETGFGRVIAPLGSWNWLRYTLSKHIA